jgi:hypothetical protein
MTEQEQRIAIAEVCREKYRKPTAEEINSCSYYQYEPDRPHNLDAMCAAVNSLDLLDGIEWLNWMDKLTRDPKAPTDDKWFTLRVLKAPSATWGEAFLRTVGKWKESQ